MQSFTMEATLSSSFRERRRCSSPLSTVVSVSSASSSSLVRCASESALQRCGAPPASTTDAHSGRRPSRVDSARSTDSSTASLNNEADAGSRPRSVVRMRSVSCSPRSSPASSDAADYPGAPRPALIVKMNACTILRQRELARRQESERREKHERAWAERRRQLDRAQLSDRLQLVRRRTPEPGPSAKERLRALRFDITDARRRRSTLEREAEYKREIQSMQARVRAMPLLLERQAVAAARRRLEQQYERKLKELGLSYEWVQQKAQQEPHDRQCEQRSFSVKQGSSAVFTRSRFQSAAVHRCPAIRSPPPESTTAVVVRQRSRSASSSLRSALSRTESASDLSGTPHDGDGPEGGLVAFTRTGDSSEEEMCGATGETRLALMDT